ncbi:hypothetical protein LSCM1_05535 [Leishmania martiniquensis]|uniref:Uncharacterized protein n=1 Tax=Leishmania martiniquensis TaxID=1580590 RepID=A0A836H8I4_9TRYP|nr:hypothetical protein LSCM1_05535 [Leishmania martiniquensis]
MSLRPFTGARVRAVLLMAPWTVRHRASAARNVCLSRRVCLPYPAIFHASAASAVAMHAAPLTTPRRAQSSLQRLLSDSSDPYLAALQEFDIPQIADILCEGPAPTGVPADLLRRAAIRADPDGVAAAQAQPAAPTPLAQRLAQSPGGAVLQSLHAVGVKHRQDTAAAAAAELASAQERYDAFPQERKAALQMERVVSHLFDGLCAMSAAMRMQAEEGTASVEQCDAAFRVYERIMSAYRDGIIAADRWRADFAPELEELRVTWQHLGDPRSMPLEMFV